LYSSHIIYHPNQNTKWKGGLPNWKGGLPNEKVDYQVYKILGYMQNVVEIKKVKRMERKRNCIVG